MSEVLLHDAVTAGTLLRQAREAAGLHVAALAVALKVPLRKLEALEADRYDGLTDAVFIRALALSVCRWLKVDPQPILDRLPQTSAPRLVQDGEGLNAPFRAPSDGAPPSWFEQLTKPVFLAVFALLLGALVLVLLPRQHEDPVVAQAVPPGTAVPTPAVRVMDTPPAPLSHPGIAPIPNAVSVPAMATPISAAPGAAMPIAAALTAPPSAASGIVVFRAKGESWVEVTDAKGAVAMRKLLAAGEAAGASGPLPLQVTIGRADATDVQVRGKSFDLRPVSRDNVAHFEIK
jgi:cytoskeleton protein RodZ